MSYSSNQRHGRRISKLRHEKYRWPPENSVQPNNSLSTVQQRCDRTSTSHNQRHFCENGRRESKELVWSATIRGVRVQHVVPLQYSVQSILPVVPPRGSNRLRRINFLSTERQQRLKTRTLCTMLIIITKKGHYPFLEFSWSAALSVPSSLARPLLSLPNFTLLSPLGYALLFPPLRDSQHLQHPTWLLEDQSSYLPKEHVTLAYLLTASWIWSRTFPTSVKHVTFNFDSCEQFADHCNQIYINDSVRCLCLLPVGLLQLPVCRSTRFRHSSTTVGTECCCTPIWRRIEVWQCHSVLRGVLHWLPIKERINFKIGILTDRSLNGLAPSYLSEMLVPVAVNPALRRNRSADRVDLTVPRAQNTSYSNCSFAIAAPMLWNSFPVKLRFSSSMTIFLQKT